MKTKEEIKAEVDKLFDENKKKREKEHKKMWDNLKLEEENGYLFVPRIPIPITQYHIDKLIGAGAIPIDTLEDNQWYFGNHRCCRLARWDAEHNIFRYYKAEIGGRYLDTCHHFQDDDNFALFIPIRKATQEEINGLKGVE